MIKVQHIQASITPNGDRIDTLICEYPRVIHSQLMTHRVFSKNSSSTRAIPLEKAIEQIKNNPAEYIWTGKKAGMQGAVITDTVQLMAATEVFNSALMDAIRSAELLVDVHGIHKQNAGRLLEPFQNIKIVLTSTEWENWDWLRNHEDAQGEIAELARAIKKARDEAEPMQLKEGELHVPFVERKRGAHTGELYYTVPEQNLYELTPEEALKVSASVCAQTSYRNSDYSLEKAEKMYGMLTGSDHIHASPFEHQAIALGQGKIDSGDFASVMFNLPEGVTHVDRKGNLWSGNIRGWIQARQLIKGHDRALVDKES